MDDGTVPEVADALTAAHRGAHGVEWGGPWWEQAELGAQGVRAGHAVAILCRACGAREELAAGEAPPAECPECADDAQAV